MWLVPATSLRLLGVIAVGGVLGSLARFLLADTMGQLAAPHVWATLVVNVAGSFAIGILALRLPPVGDRWWHRPFWITGVLGGFTTFSAFALDTVGLLDEGNVVGALAYLAGTVAAGLCAVALGMRLAGERA